MRCVAEALLGWHQGPCTQLRVPGCGTRDHVHVPVSALGAMLMSEVLLLGAKLIPLLALSNRLVHAARRVRRQSGTRSVFPETEAIWLLGPRPPNMQTGPPVRLRAPH